MCEMDGRSKGGRVGECERLAPVDWMSRKSSRGPPGARGGGYAERFTGAQRGSDSTP